MSPESYDITYEDLNPTFLFIYTCERTEDETNYHNHDFMELSIILKGEGIYYIDGGYYPVKEGDLILLNPGTYHKSLLAPPKKPILECYIAFSNFQFVGSPKDCIPLPDNQIILHMDAALKQEIGKICSAMQKEYITCRPGQYFMLKSYVIQLLLLLLREEKDAKECINGCVFESTNRNYVVKRIIQYLSQHYQEKISLDQIAQNMYLSTFYISKIFKSETGDTPINYLINLRMEKARELLEDQEHLSIQDVAAAVGYEDAYHFSKLFKKHFGVAPSKWEKL